MDKTPKQTAKDIESICNLYSKRKKSDLKLLKPGFKKIKKNIKQIELLKEENENITSSHRKIYLERGKYLNKKCQEKEIRLSAVKKILGTQK